MLKSVSNNPFFTIPDSKSEQSKIYSQGSDGKLNWFIEVSRKIVARTKSIILDDDRKLQFNTRILPWSAICALSIETANGVQHGTGWMAGPNIVITCGHCVYSNAFSGWAKKIVVTPGRSSRGSPFGSTTSNTFFCSEKWQSAQNIALDIGAIFLDDPIGTKIGWFRYDEVGPEIEKTIVNISGYPEFDGNFDKLLTHEGAILKFHDGRLFYPIDTDVGQSGAPVWVKQSPENTIPIAVGVHAYNPQKTPSSFGIEANSATALTPEITNLIHRWATATKFAGS